MNQKYEGKSTDYLPIESIELGIHGVHSSKSDSANLDAKHL